MNTEMARIANQLHCAFQGDPWHGSNIRDLLAGVTASQAAEHPIKDAHSIWELVLHTELYVRIAFEAIGGTPMPKLYIDGSDWFSVVDCSDAAWTAATEHLFASSSQLEAALQGMDDSRLSEIVPGRDYTFYFLLHGIVQHSLYHGGQIALLSKAIQPQQ